MAEFIIDLCSFSVEAADEEDARAKAIAMLKDGTETARIDRIFEA